MSALLTFIIGLYLGEVPDITVLLLGVTSVLIGLFGLIADAMSKIMMNIKLE